MEIELNFAEKYNTFEKCLKYENEMKEKNRDDEFYWKNAGGSIIRESEENDGIGNRNIYATIQLADMIGSDGYDDKNHAFCFVVFLYINGKEEGFDKYETISEAIEDYELTCKMIKRLTETE